MIVYDVVVTVERGANTSALPGRWLVDHFSDEQSALDYASKCNDRRTVPGIVYSVERHDESSPDRAISEGDFRYACHARGLFSRQVAGTPQADEVIRRFIATSQPDTSTADRNVT